MAGLGQRGRDFQGGHGSHLSVVVPARGDGVDVGSEQQRGQVRVGTCPAADQIPREVGRDLEPGLPHEGRHPLAGGEVGVTVGDPVDPSLGRGTEAGQFGERSVEAVPVHQQVGWDQGDMGAAGQPPERGRNQAEREPS